MKKISLIYIASENYFQNALCLPDNLKNAGAEYELIVVMNGHNNPQNVKLFSSFHPAWVVSASVRSSGDILNEALKKITGRYVCIIPEPLLLPSGWLSEIEYQYELIQNTGVCSISKHMDKGNITWLFTADDGFVQVWQKEDCTIDNGVFFFDIKFLNSFGGFNPSFSNGYEYKDYSFRLAKNGFHCYYLPYYYAVAPFFQETNNFLKTTDRDYKRNCRRMIREKNFGIKITEMPENEKQAFIDLGTMRQKLDMCVLDILHVEFCEKWGIIINKISDKDILHIQDFSKKHNLSWEISPTISITNNIPVITVLFYSNKT